MKGYVGLSQIASVSQGLATSGPGAGARPGDWEVGIIDSSAIQDDRLVLAGLRTLEIEANARTEKHLLRPYDVLLTARSTSVKAALAPPSISRTVAGATLLVVRARQPELGVGHFLWYYFTSGQGRAQLASRLVASSTLSSLSARAVAEVSLALPEPLQLHRLASLIDESERAYAAAIEAAQLRRDSLRDAIIGTLSATEER